MTTRPDMEVTMEIHTLLGAYMKGREADFIVVRLAEIMQDKRDGPELVRLFQKWNACI